MDDRCRTDPLGEAVEIIKAAGAHLAYLEEYGCLGIGRDTLKRARRAARAASGDRNPAAALREVRDELGECERCGLSKGRTNIVFGDGDPYSRLMFVGEGPGADEDAQGIPFVGRAGRLLTDIIEKGMKIKRSEVYIANIVKCRPPKNRDPEPEERATCMPFLEKQIEAIEPRAIVALGKVAAHSLLGTELPISRLRGSWSEYRSTPVMPTYHPSYLLRNPGAKREVWEDIKKVMEKLGLPVEE